MKIIPLNSRQKDQSTATIWSVDRIARLIIGILNIPLLLATYFISHLFIIGICMVNLNLVYTSLTNYFPFKNLLKQLGAKERERFYNSKGEIIRTENICNISNKCQNPENN